VTPRNASLSATLAALLLAGPGKSKRAGERPALFNKDISDITY
jgi:hypothetical protein